MELSKKKKIRKIIAKAISVILTIGVLLFVAYYLFNTFIGTSKLQMTFKAWAKENEFLAYTLFLVLTPLINIIPGISSIFFITLANMMFNDNTVGGMFKAFGASFGSVMLSTILLFELGRWGGKRVVKWVVGEDDLRKADDILTYGGKAALPFIYLFPLFPDDTMSFLCGITKMSFWYNFFCAFFFRGIGVFCCCFFGTNLIPYKDFTWWQWFLAILGAILLVSAVLYIVYRYYRYLRYKKEGRHYLLTSKLHTKEKNQATK
jgi:uncharacterized membrane protein YdjX (TVP38/TMEM64 family)